MALDLDPLDIIGDKSRWLVSDRNPNPTKEPLLLLAFSTDEVADRLLHHNPHWVQGNHITFKEFNSSPITPNQCCCCWKVGHLTWRCGATSVTCRICSEFHDTLSHCCSSQNCGRVGKTCKHTPAICPNCGKNHPAWEKSCVKSLIQKAVNPPKKKAAKSQPKKATDGSPASATASFICAIKPGTLGYPQ